MMKLTDDKLFQEISMSKVGPIDFLSIEPSKLKQRKGCFRLKAEFSDLSFIQKIMSQVIVTRCEYLWSTRVFYYDAVSPLFDICLDNNIPPDYVFSHYVSSQNEELNLICTKIEDRPDASKVSDS